MFSPYPTGDTNFVSCSKENGLLFYPVNQTFLTEAVIASFRYRWYRDINCAKNTDSGTEYIQWRYKLEYRKYIRKRERRGNPTKVKSVLRWAKHITGQARWRRPKCNTEIGVPKVYKLASQWMGIMYYVSSRETKGKWHYQDSVLCSNVKWKSVFVTTIEDENCIYSCFLVPCYASELTAYWVINGFTEFLTKHVFTVPVYPQCKTFKTFNNFFFHPV